MAGIVYDADKSGNAPKGASVDDFVKTAGGTYLILDGNKYQGMSSEQLSSLGVGFNPSSGLYSKKVSNTSDMSLEQQYQPTNVTFNTNSWKDSYINKLTSGLDANLARDRANLEKTYNTNKMQQENHARDVNREYERSIAQLEKDAYINNVLGKQQASRQGLTSSAQGVALFNSILNRANEQSVGLWKSKTETINNIKQGLDALAANYNIDMDLLESKYNSDTLSAMSDAELQALDRQLEIDITNASNSNSWNMTKYQIANSNQQAEKDRELELYLSRLSGGGGSRQKEEKLNPEYELSIASNYLTQLAANYGDDWDTKLSTGRQRQFQDAYSNLQYGKITASEFEAIAGQLAYEQHRSNNTSKPNNKNKTNIPINQSPQVLIH